MEGQEVKSAVAVIDNGKYGKREIRFELIQFSFFKRLFKKLLSATKSFKFFNKVFF